MDPAVKYLESIGFDSKSIHGTKAKTKVNYPIRVDFEIRQHGEETMIYKRVDGHKPQVIVLNKKEMETIKNAS